MSAPESSSSINRPGSASSAPVVSVVVPVHNTCDYLGACLDSLVAQTLDERCPGALEVLAIDDGSTDGSGELLDEYAAKHPDLFLVEHHEASGGPARPRNRALDLARGKYVFFLDSDDYLWEEALLRLVDAAQEWDADVVLGRMVGAGGRGVYQGVYRATRPDIDLCDPALPYSLSVTKLFRRSLIEHHGLRFDPRLRMGSDQPFAVRAMLRSGRISVLADHTYYYAVMREDRSNITYSVPWRAQLKHLSEMIHQIAAAIPAGDLRDNVLSRHFTWELDKLLVRPWGGLDEDEKRELVAGVGRLADDYLTPGIAGRLRTRRRLAHRLAQHGRTDLLDELFDMVQDGTVPAFALGPGRAQLAYPGFGELPVEWYDATIETVAPLLEQVVHVERLGWDGTTLVVEGRARVLPGSAEQVQAVLVPVNRARLQAPEKVRRSPGRAFVTAPVELTADGDGSRFTARVDTAALLAATDRPGRRWSLRLRLTVGERVFDVAVTDVQGTRTRARQGLRFYRLVARRIHGHVHVFRRRIPLWKALREKLGR